MKKLSEKQRQFNNPKQKAISKKPKRAEHNKQLVRHRKD